MKLETYGIDSAEGVDSVLEVINPMLAVFDCLIKDAMAFVYFDKEPDADEYTVPVIQFSVLGIDYVADMRSLFSASEIEEFDRADMVKFLREAASAIESAQL